PCTGGDGFSFCPSQPRWVEDSNCAVQQRLHLPRNGTWRSRVRRSPRCGADDVSSSSHASQKFAGSQGSFRVLASTPHRTQESGSGDRVCGWHRGTKRWHRPKSQGRRTASASARHAVDARLHLVGVANATKVSLASEGSIAICERAGESDYWQRLWAYPGTGNSARVHYVWAG